MSNDIDMVELAEAVDNQQHIIAYYKDGAFTYSVGDELSISQAVYFLESLKHSLLTRDCIYNDRKDAMEDTE